MQRAHLTFFERRKIELLKRDLSAQAYTKIKGPLGCLVSVKKRLKYTLLNTVVIIKVNVLLSRKKLVCYLRLQYLQEVH